MVSTDLDLSALRAGLAGRLVGSQVLYYEAVGSTMDEARRLADEGRPEGTVVIAEEQSAGRGRFDRAWVSPPGDDLLFSVLLRPQVEQLPYVNMAATLAVSGAIAPLTGLTPTIKWPNDVRIGGRKVCGTLIETSMESERVRYAVVGMGLNVNFDPSPHPDIVDTATSLYVESGRRLDRTMVFSEVLKRLDDLYGAVKEGRSLTEEWAARLETLGRDVRVRWRDQVYEGLAREVDEQGNLVIANDDGSTVTVVAGEVTLQGKAASGPAP